MKTIAMKKLLSGLTLAASCIALNYANAATLVSNVKGYTLNDKGNLIQFSNLVMDEGKVVALDVQPKNYDIESTIDGGGKVMLPGLIDAHGHLLGLGANY